MAIRAAQEEEEEVVLISTGMEIIGHLVVIFPIMIYRMFKCREISVVENVRKLQDVLTLHGQHSMVVLVG